MRVRHLIAQQKTIQSDSRWSSHDMVPRFAPVYPKTRPMRAGWQWRSARVNAGSQPFVIVAECLPKRDNWKAMLIILASESSSASVIARFEHHGSHPEIHGHADCHRGGLEWGPASMDNLTRFPNAGSLHRRTHSWTEDSFWRAAMVFFRVEDVQGSLDI